MAALLSLAAIVERDRGVASACYRPLYTSYPHDPQPGGSVGRGLTTDHHSVSKPDLRYVSQDWPRGIRRYRSRDAIFRDPYHNP